MGCVNTRFRVLVVLVLAALLGVMTGCTAAPGSQGPSDSEPVVGHTEPAETADPDGRPSIAEAEAAVLAIAREEYPEIPLESATAEAIGRDAQGTWWVQAWTTASPEYPGEPGEQWFVAFDGEAWTLMDYGTGLSTGHFPEIAEWEQLP